MPSTQVQSVAGTIKIVFSTAVSAALSAVPSARAGPLAAPNRVGRSSWVYRWAVSPIGGMAAVQVQVLILPRRLQRELGMGMIFVTHDLGVAAEIADTIAVMYAGRIVESGPVAEILSAPAYPYNRPAFSLRPCAANRASTT